jgi:ParB family chromosome partitioning protein
MTFDDRLPDQNTQDGPRPDTAKIVELDPAAIERSFIADRMEWEDGSYRALRDSIAAEGQASPILVRPHPTETGRYQVAFGHRRLRAARELGQRVRCIIRPLTDRDLVIAQGQENSARADLSFIERGRFALALFESGHKRPTIMQALCVDKTTLSRLMKIVARLPADIVDAVGPAPSAGRERWTALAKAYGKTALTRPVDLLLESAVFKTAPSDKRFEMLYRYLTRPEPKQLPNDPGGLIEAGPGAAGRAAPRRWISHTGQTVATVIPGERCFVLNIDEKAAPGFGGFVLSRLEGLYQDYSRTVPQKRPVGHIFSR